MPPLPDIVRGPVRVLLVGINPGLRSAEVGHHFAGASNRFWRLLSESGLVPEPLTFADDHRLPEWGLGLTNIVSRATSGSSELTPAEFAAGARRLIRKLRIWRPAILAPVGVSVWRAVGPAAGMPEAARGPVNLGLQPGRVEGARVYVLPNPSGRNAHVGYAAMLEAFKGLAKGSAQFSVHSAQ